MRGFLLFSATAAILAAAPPPSESPVSGTSALARGDAPMQKVGPDDVLSIVVADSPELTRNFRVFADGTLMLPLIKEKIQVKGKNTKEVEQAITEALVSEEILVRPVVSVSVAEYHSIPVTVLGAVRSPITFQAAGDVHLLDAITRAGGLAPDAGAEILVTKPGENGAPALTQRVPVKGLVEEAQPELNIRLWGGEEVRVPNAGRVFVLGNVRHSGAYPILDVGDLSVMKVIAESEGLAPFASKQAYIYRKESVAGGRSEIPIQLKDIMSRKAPDVMLQANDILYVPDDKHKRLSATALERITGFGVATASGFLVFH